MQVTKEMITKIRVRLTIGLDAKELAPYIEKVYRDLAKGLKIAGFRPGKAPQSVVEKEVGQDKFYAEVLEEALPQVYYQAVLQENIVSVSRPEIKIKKYVPTSGLEFEAEVEILPEIVLPDYKSIKIKKNEVKVTDSDIKKMLGDLQNNFSEFQDVVRAAAEGDRVEIDFEGTKGNIPIEGGTSKNHPLVIGQGMFIPGFEDNLVGMKKEEEKSFDITFPADYHEKSLAGQKVVFRVKMISISEKVMPELTDEFARKLGPFKDLEELKKQLEKDIAQTKEIEERRRLENEILEKISSKTDIEVPESLAKEETLKMLDEANANLANSGLTLDKYLEMTKKTREDVEKETRPEAEKRVRFGLVLSEISRVEGMTATKKEIESEKEKILANFGEKAGEYAPKLDDHEAEHSIENSIIARKTIDKLIEYCLE
jgi:trigger factor